LKKANAPKLPPWQTKVEGVYLLIKKDPNFGGGRAMPASDKIGTFFCRTCQEFFEAAEGEHQHDAANCPTCQAEGMAHCPDCGAPVEESLNKRCPSCSAAYVG
jgi:hypothetical protein